MSFALASSVDLCHRSHRAQKRAVCTPVFRLSPCVVWSSAPAAPKWIVELLTTTCHFFACFADQLISILCTAAYTSSCLWLCICSLAIHAAVLPPPIGAQTIATAFSAAPLQFQMNTQSTAAAFHAVILPLPMGAVAGSVTIFAMVTLNHVDAQRVTSALLARGFEVAAFAPACPPAIGAVVSSPAAGTTAARDAIIVAFATGAER